MPVASGVPAADRERQAVTAERESIAGGYATGRQRSQPGAGGWPPAGRGVAGPGSEGTGWPRSCLDRVRGEPRDWLARACLNTLVSRERRVRRRLARRSEGA